jgi:hypothetical protein
MARVTAKQLREKATQIILLKAAYDQYKALEDELKTGMLEINFKEIDLGEAGRVFVSTSERITVSPELALETLGPKLAAKIIQIKKSVPNNLIKAFFEVGDICEGQRDDLLAKAEKTSVTSLYVRPLN